MDAKYGYDIRTEIVGTRGYAFRRVVRQTALTVMTRAGSSHDVIAHWLTRFAGAYLREMSDFVDAVRHGRDAARHGPGWTAVAGRGRRRRRVLPGTPPRAGGDRDACPPSTGKGRLHRSLKLRDLIFYGIIVIQPTAPMPMFGVVSQEARGHVVTAVLIAMVAMLLTAVSYGRMARVYPSAGSAYAYISGEFGGVRRLLYRMERAAGLPAESPGLHHLVQFRSGQLLP